MKIIDKILKVEPTGIKVNSGKIIISAPFMRDLYFGRSIVLLLEHNNDGSMGFIINKKTKILVSDMVEDFPSASLPLYLGGPVQTDSIFFIHNRPDLIDDSLKIHNDMYWGGNFKQLRTFITEGMIQPNEVRFFVGYSGWSANQLNEELAKETWVVSNPISFDKIANTDSTFLWQDTVKTLGRKYSHWLNFPDYPNEN